MKRLLSGIQPTNNLTLGNYLGAIKNFVALQDQYEIFLFVADLHSITTNIFDNTNFLENKRSIVATYLAAGMDPHKTNIFYQSDIYAIPMLAHIMLCSSTLGELERMTQFKDKSLKATKMANNTSMIPTGLLTYPTLMAADILAFDADIVPVGQDQKQHLELTRTLAQRFNKRYGQTFNIPNPFIAKVGAKIMDLIDPSMKMSKSSPKVNGTIFLNDSRESIIKKIKSAMTDSLNQVRYDPINQPGVSNLMTIYSLIKEIDFQTIENMYINKNYGEFKLDLAEIVADFVENINKRVNYWLNSNELDIIIDKSSKIANKVAFAKTEEALKKMNLK